MSRRSCMRPVASGSVLALLTDGRPASILYGQQTVLGVDSIRAALGRASLLLRASLVIRR